MDCFNIKDKSNLNYTKFIPICIDQIATKPPQNFHLAFFTRCWFHGDLSVQIVECCCIWLKIHERSFQGTSLAAFQRSSWGKVLINVQISPKHWLRISCIFYTFDCKFVSCAFFVIVFVLVRQTSLTAKMGFMGISAQNSKMD